MPTPKVLSGAEVVRILASFAFDVASQRGSHIKLRRALPDGARQPLPFRITVNWIAARCSESTASPAIRSGRRGRAAADFFPALFTETVYGYQFSVRGNAELSEGFFSLVTTEN